MLPYGNDGSDGADFPIVNQFAMLTDSEELSALQGYSRNAALAASTKKFCNICLMWSNNRQITQIYARVTAAAYYYSEWSSLYAPGITAAVESQHKGDATVAMLNIIWCLIRDSSHHDFIVYMGHATTLSTVSLSQQLLLNA